MAKQNPPSPPPVPLDLWRELYQAAARFQLLAPWRWMDDTQILGISNEHGVRLICTLGNLGEVFGLASYRGSVGVSYLLRLLRGEIEPESPEAGYAQDSLLVDFVPRQQLRKEDRAIIQQLGFQPVAARPKLFPEFYSHKPGYVPWFIDETEGRLLLDDLCCTARFAELLSRHPDLCDSHPDGDFPFFPASLKEPLTPGQLEWRTVVATPPPGDRPIDLQALDLGPLLALPQAGAMVWEAGAAYSPMPIGESPRPYWPKLGLVADARTGFILAHQLGASGTTMSETAAQGLVNAIRAAGARPVTIRLDSAELANALERLAALLKIGIRLVGSLPMIEEARRSLEGFSKSF